MRGAITDKIQEIAKKFLERKITRVELRFIPYIQYVMANEQKLDIQKVSSKEREILKKWKEADLVEGGASGLSITKEFWNFMCEILWEGYVVGGSDGRKNF